jgi:aminoglycoside 3-N-acetyltransferase
MIRWLPKSMKQFLKGKWKRARASYVRHRYSFTGSALLAKLRSLGVQRGDVLLVHSSMENFEGFLGKPTEVITILQEAIGAEGTLLMPTLPFSGTASEYVAKGQVFDSRRTPSKMGLITELFRRSPGVVRSIHPTHSVAAWGAAARTLVEGHYRAKTPCGKDSPYSRLLDCNGKILFLGTGVSVMTFFHAVEEDLELLLPFSPFTEEHFQLQSRDEHGDIFVTDTRLFAPRVSRKRNLNHLVTALREHGAWNETRLGKLGILLLTAQDVLASTRALAARGVYCYDI